MYKNKCSLEGDGTLGMSGLEKYTHLFDSKSGGKAVGVSGDHVTFELPLLQ